MRKILLFLAAALAVTGVIAQNNVGAKAQNNTGATAQHHGKDPSASGYQLPPKDIADLLLAPPTPAVSTDRKGEWMLLSSRSSYPPVEELAQPELRIAGLRFNPDNYALSRQNFVNGFSIKNIHTGKEYSITSLPTPLRAGNISWNPAENHISFTNTTN